MCVVLQLDNEPTFRSRSLTVVSGALRFKLDYGPAGQSRIRGKIERFFGELNHNGLAAIPGKSFSNPRERAEYDSAGLAFLTLEELRRWVTLWIVDVYHNRPHSGLLGMTPLDKWKATLPLGVHHVDRLEDLDAVLCLSFERTIQREGIRLFGLRYQDNALGRLARRRRGKGMTYPIQLDPNDLTRVALYDELEERWVYVGCTTPELVEGVTLPEWREACRLTYRNNKSSRSRETMQDTLAMLTAEFAGGRATRERKLVKPDELDWLRENETNEIFETVLEDGVYRVKERRRSDDRMRGEVPEVEGAEAAVMDDSGPVSVPELDAGEGGLPSAVAPTADPAEAPAGPADSEARAAPINLHDPSNW